MAENGSRGSGGRKKFVSQKPGQAVFKAIVLEDIASKSFPAFPLFANCQSRSRICWSNAHPQRGARSGLILGTSDRSRNRPKPVGLRVKRIVMQPCVRRRPVEAGFTV